MASPIMPATGISSDAASHVTSHVAEHDVCFNASSGLWSHVTQRRACALGAQIIALIAIGLWLESRFGLTGQRLTNIWALTVLLVCAKHGRRHERITLALATALSAVGEVTMSSVVGLYDYRYHAVPLFVPPGHALVMTLGALIDRRLARHARSAIVGVAVFAAVWAAYAWSTDSDRFGVLLCVLFAFVLWRGPARSLYAVMFALALALELFGTAIHAWTWARSVPVLDLSAGNPPFAAGAFYCSLDLVVLGLGRRLLAQYDAASTVRACNQNLASAVTARPFSEFNSAASSPLVLPPRARRKSTLTMRPDCPLRTAS